MVTDGIDRLREGARVAVIDAGAVTRADQAAQDQASAAACLHCPLPPDVREKLQKMSPEERRASCASGAQMGAGGAAGSSVGGLCCCLFRVRWKVPPPLPRRPPRRDSASPQQRVKHQPVLLHQPPQARRRLQRRAAPQRLLIALRNLHGHPPQVKALLDQMPADERARVMAMPQEERRA